MLWLDKLVRHLKPDHAILVDANDLSAELRDQWGEWLPAHGVLLPCGPGFLLFARDDPFVWEEVSLLERLADLVSLTRMVLSPRKLAFKMSTGRLAWA